jgi:hypothetical protein
VGEALPAAATLTTALIILWTIDIIFFLFIAYEAWDPSGR